MEVCHQVRLQTEQLRTGAEFPVTMLRVPNIMRTIYGEIGEGEKSAGSTGHSVKHEGCMLEGDEMKRLVHGYGCMPLQ